MNYSFAGSHPSPHSTCRRAKNRFSARESARCAVGVAVILTWAGSAFAQGRTLEGVWGVVTQERNCTTNAPLGPPTRALVTYDAGGAFSDSRNIPVFLPGQLSETHGLWRHDGGQTYATRFITMINFDSAPGTPPGSPGFQAGWIVGAQTITLTGPDTFTSTGRSEFFNLNREVWRVGCASRTGERFR